MHNRVRMITASFLVKDLHLPWQWGARHFMRHLVDGDIASNNHGWQWTAGTGTDAAPYFRIFNPQSQSEKFDPDGSYIREFVPELAQCPTSQIHQPGAGGFAGYSAPMVDHSVEREESLARYKAVSGK
jgi:deoxyribodipyrimidine photo-lyase